VEAVVSPVPTISYWWGVEQSTTVASVATFWLSWVSVAMSEMQSPALRSSMVTVLALGSAVALEEDVDEALAFDEGEASSESFESCDSLSEEVDESSLLDGEESVVVFTASSSQALRLRASRSAVGRAMRAEVFVRMG
jgi:hypothetical protein